MTTLQEYAALSAYVYNNERGNRTTANRLDLASGWTELRAANGFPAQASYDENFFSFTAGAYVNPATGEIVVSYKGTDFLLEFAGRAWNTVGDMVTDLAAGIGGKLSAAQFLQAAAYYQDVKRWAAANGYDDSKISFTGHSLGAGIASVMSVWFNRPATVFADAPFEATASSMSMLAAVSAMLLAAGRADADFDAFVADSVVPGTPVFFARQERVINYYVRGEFLDYVRNPISTVYGATNPIDIGNQPLGLAVALHSMNLHLALLADDRLRDLATKIPQLIPALLDPKLYQADPNGRTKDLITALVNDQINKGFANDSALKRFTTDLLKLGASDGTTAQPALRTALIAAAMEYYYFKDPASATALFTVADNGIHFKYSDIGVDQIGLKSPRKLNDAMQAFLGADEWNAVGHKLEFQDAWHIQSGEAGMVWTASAAAHDAAIGGAQTDVLDAGAGDDILIGGAGEDYLIGGTGNDILIGGLGIDLLEGGNDGDRLLGGQGADIYNFTGSFGPDKIEDSDGDGIVQVEGLGNLTGAGAKKVFAGGNEWQTDGKQITYSLITVSDTNRKDLVISFLGRSDRITIKNWTNGQLGITLGSEVVQPQTGNSFAGDSEKLPRSDDATRYAFDSYGNYAAGTAQPAAQDVMTGTAGADLLQGLGGNDGLAGGAGDDVVEGGDGDDLLIGGMGSDTLNGGAGHDHIFGSGSGTLTYPTSTTEPPIAPAGEESIRGFSWVVASAPSGWSIYGYNGGDPLPDDAGNIIDAGADSDWVAAGTGSDVVQAGSGDDIVYGMAGNDVIYGGTGADSLTGDSSNIAVSNYNYTDPTQHGADVLVGEAGNDTLVGNGGDDALYGGADDDELLGDDSSDTTPDGVHGNDYLDGGDGNDRLFGGGRDDELFGGVGNDTLHGDDSALSVAGAAHGADYLDGEDGNDMLQGDGGADTLFGGQGNDALYGDDDPSRLAGAYHGDDYLDGEEGDDHLEGSGGADVLYGGAGADFLFGDSAVVVGLAGQYHGDDYLDGEDGNDQLEGNGGSDILIGGAGVDVLFGDSRDAGLSASANGDDFLSGDEGDDRLFGGGGDDELHAGDGNDQIRGDDITSVIGASAHGKDYIDGGAGNDTMWGDGGDDVLIGGDGDDWLAGEDELNSAAVSLLSGNDTLDGGAGRDNLIGGNGNDLLDGGAGSDSLYGGNGNDVLDGGSDDDGLVGGAGDDALHGGAGSDTAWGGDGADSLNGNEDNDDLWAGSGNDTLNGDAGDDRLYGEAGDDVFIASAGFDRMIGENGSDSYRFGRGAGHDVVQLFAVNPTSSDRVVLDAGIAPADITLWRESENLVIQLGDGTDQLRVLQYFRVPPNNGPAEQDALELRFADGVVWNAAELAARTIQQVTNVSTNGSGIDTVTTNSSYTLGADQENLTVSGDLDAWLYGNGLNNVLTGNAGDNVFNGPYGGWVFDPAMDLANLPTNGDWVYRNGADTLVGGAGDDVYFVGVPQGWLNREIEEDDDIVIEQVGEGTDTIVSYAYHTAMESNVEYLIALSQSQWVNSSGPILHGYEGNALANVIDASRVGSTALFSGFFLSIDGRGGADTMIGSAFASNTFVVDDPGDVIIDNSQLHDTVATSINYTLPDGIQDLTVQAPWDSNLLVTGTGNAHNNVLRSKNSRVIETEDGVFATYGVGDVLIGLDGDDTYYIDAGDRVVEAAGGGIDRVVGASGNASDYQNVEILEAVGTLIGDDRDNIILGSVNYGTGDTLYGGAGNDEITDSATREPRFLGSDADFRPQYADRDELHGGDGNDLLISTLGNDVVAGDAGDDRIDFRNMGYTLSSGWSGIVYNVAPGGSVAFARGDGNDTVSGSTSMHFMGEVDIADLWFSRDNASLVIALNDGGGSITISDVYSADVISGALPLYAMVTFDGTDRLRYENEFFNGNGAGAWGDLIAARVQTGNANVVTEGNDYAIGGRGADALLGAGGDDQLFGGRGNDTLSGGAGGDLLFGGEGNDVLSPGGPGFNGQYAVADELDGGAGDDVYLIDVAAGYINIFDHGSGTDAIQFAVGINPSDIRVKNDGNLRLENLDQSLVVTVAYGFATGNGTYYGDAAENYAVEQVRFADGTVWTLEQMREMAMRIDGTAGADSIAGTDDEDHVYGYAGNDTIDAGMGNDLLDGGSGNDTLRGGEGDDTYVVDSASDVLFESANSGVDTVLASVTRTLGSNFENLTLTGTVAINATGNSLSNVLIGNAAANTLSGGTGADTMVGGAGNDIYVVDNVGDVVTELADEGVDTLQSGITLVLGSNVENLTLTGTSAISGTGNVLTGNGANNTLTGGAGNDTLDGGAGSDTMAGGAGNDVYTVNASTDVVTDLANEGLDTVQSSVTLTLASNVENLALTGTSAINGTGNALDNVLTGNSANNTLTGAAGNDTLDGGAGSDTMIGGIGNDNYVVNVSTDVVTENANEGTDTVQAAATYTLGNNIENLTLGGTSAINGTGNTLANILTGNSANNTLSGGTGVDTMIGGAGNDTYVVDNTGDVVTELAAEGTDLVQSSVTCTLSSNVENLTLTGTSAISGAGNALDNVLTGNSANNTLNGGAGNDTLNGGAGNDTMAGGAGNDTYVVNVATDVVSELASEGTDTVQSGVTLTLGNNVENLTLTGTSAINGTGNTLDNVLTGNSANNTLTGGAGNDTLDGGAGNDTLRGGTGDDIYVVNVTTDVVTENANEGIDAVRSSVTLTLGSNVENLTLTGTSAINGTGNTLNNVLTGNSAANTLTGGAGDDTYDGGTGNDVYSDTSTTSAEIYRWGLGSGTDSISDAGGADRVDVFAGITEDQLRFARNGNHLEMTVAGQTDKLIVNNWYLSAANQIEEFRLSDGSAVLASQVQGLISAMAAFSAPAAGSSSFTPQQQVHYAPLVTPTVM